MEGVDSPQLDCAMFEHVGWIDLGMHCPMMIVLEERVRTTRARVEILLHEVLGHTNKRHMGCFALEPTMRGTNAQGCKSEGPARKMPTEAPGSTQCSDRRVCALDCFMQERVAVGRK